MTKTRKTKPNRGRAVLICHWLGREQPLISHWLSFKCRAGLFLYIMKRSELQRIVWTCIRYSKTQREKSFWDINIIYLEGKFNSVSNNVCLNNMTIIMSIKYCWIRLIRFQWWQMMVSDTQNFGGEKQQQLFMNIIDLKWLSDFCYFSGAVPYHCDHYFDLFYV